MLKALAALLVLALPDAGLPPAVYADRAQLELDLADGGTLTFAGECFTGADGGTDCGGGWLPTPRLEAHGAEVARLRARDEVLTATPPLFSTSTWAALVVSNLLTLALTAYGTWSFVRWLDGH